VGIAGAEVTDRDKLKSLLDEWGVPYSEDVETGLPVIILEADSQYQNVPGRNKIAGYASFVTHFTFDENGGFLHVGIWE
jgi:hypothetical protein